MSTATNTPIADVNPLTNDERRALQMWFRQAIAEVEKREALESITRFYNGESPKHDTHKSHHTTRRSPRTRGTRTHELV